MSLIISAGVHALVFAGIGVYESTAPAKLELPEAFSRQPSLDFVTLSDEIKVTPQQTVSQPIAPVPTPQPAPVAPEPKPEPPPVTKVALAVPVERETEVISNATPNVVNLVEPTPVAASAPVTGVEITAVSTAPAIPATTSSSAAADTGSSEGDATSGIVTRARPSYRKNPIPSYPAAAKRRHLEGTVLLTVGVEAGGRVAFVRVKNSSGFSILDNAAIEAVRQWEFEPARANNHEISSEVEVPLRFKME